MVNKTTDILKEEKNSRKIGTLSAENEARTLQDDIVQCRLLNNEDAGEERQSNHRLKNSNTKVNKSEKVLFLKKIATNLDLDLLHDNYYIAIILGR